MNPSPRDNFYRCMTLIVDNGNEAAWDLLDYYLSKQGTTLKDFIQNNQHEIYHLCYNYGGCCRCQYGTVNKPKSRILYQSQLGILLDTKGRNIPCNVHVRSKPTCSHTINDHFANPNIATKQLDLTLCRCLLFNFTNILPQGSIERNAFEDLINMRNKCCHAAKGEISSKDYQTYKAQIEKCLLALAQVYGKTHDMQLKIKDAEKRPLDESICKQLQQTVLQEQVLQGVSGLHKHIESSQKAEERTTIEIQKIGKSTKRTLRAINSSTKSAGHTASKIKKIEESTKRTLMAVKSSKRSVERKLKVNTERTMHAIDSSREAEGRTATKIQKLDERMSKCETSKRSRLLGLTKTEIDGHLKECTFVETPAVQACIKLLETNSLLVLTAAAGTGKSRNSLEILLQFQVKNPEFKTIKLTELHDFTDVVTEEEKLVILFEDIFGRTNTRFAENTDVQIIDRIHACTINGNIKVILTVRDTIRMSCQWILNSHKIFHGKCEVDLSSETFKMKKNEKESLLLKYFAAHNFQLLEYNDPENYFKEVILDPLITATVNRVTFHNIVESEPLLGFPEACSLFTGNRKLTRLGLSFFKHPSKYLFEEIEKLRKNGKYNEQDRMSYVTLVYILLKEDVLDPDDIELNICNEILESCYGISNKKLPVCHITDAASEMIGRYLIFQCDDCAYHLQHQTIFESILISYNRVDPGLILSRLSFDFIREMVRLQKYKPREGEIVMEITQKYYSMLANRIIEIIQSEYFNKSLPLNFQLLCESQIIKENDEVFLKHLIEKAHHAYFLPEYDLQTFVTYGGKCKLCQLYIPALLLERITQQNKMNKSITLLIDHITSTLDSESEEEIEFVCKSSLFEAFLHVCELENNENILNIIWVSIKSLDMSGMKENIRSSINTLCSRCPITTIKWIVNNNDRSTFDMNHILNTACEFKRLDVVKFLCTTLLAENGHGVSIHENVFLHELDKSKNKGTAVNQLDFTVAFIAAIKNVWNDRDEPVSKWLIKNVPHQLFDMKLITKNVLDMKCMEDLRFLITNVDNCMLDMKLVYTNQYKEGRKSIEKLLKWMGANVEQQKVNILELNNLPCMVQDTEVVKYLFKNFDHSLLDCTSLLLSAINSDWRGRSKDLVDWLVLNIDLKYFNFIKVIKEVDETKEDVTKKLLEKVNHTSLDMKQILNQACHFGWLDVVTWTLHNIDHAILDIKEAMNKVPHFYCLINVLEVKEDKYRALFKLFLVKVNHGLLDMKEVINRACRYYWLDVVTLVLDTKENHAMFDVREIINILFDECDQEYVKNINNKNNDDVNNIRNKCKQLLNLFLEKVNQNLMDMEKTLNQACRYGWLDVAKWVLENIEHKKLDMKEAMYIVHSSMYAIFENDEAEDESKKDRRDQYESVIKLILEKVSHALLDLQDVLNQACRYCSVDVVTLLLEKNDHKKLDMKKAINSVYIAWKYDNDDEDMNDSMDKYEPLFKRILEKVNHDSLDFKEILHQACRYGLLGVVKLMLENAEHKKLDIMVAVNIVYSSIIDDYDENDINNSRGKYEPLIRQILKKVNHDLLDLKTVFYQAFCKRCLEVVSFLLENTYQDTLDVKGAMNTEMNTKFVVNFFSLSMRKDNKRKMAEPLIKLILEKVNHGSLPLKEIMNYGCCNCCLNVVRYLLENIDHNQLDVKGAVNDVYRCVCDIDYYDEDMNNIREKYEPLFRHILEKVNHNLLDLKTIFHLACKIGCVEVVTYLLENIDHDQLDVKEAVYDVFRFVVCKVDYYNDGIINLREKIEPLILHILEKVNHDLLDLKTIFHLACRIRCVEVVTYLLENIDHDQLDVKEAVYDVFRFVVCKVDCYNDSNINLREKYETLIRHILEKVNHDLLDWKTIFHLACRIRFVEVVTYLLEKKDHTTLDLMGAVKTLCYPSQNENTDDEFWYVYSNEAVTKLLLPKVKVDTLDVEVLLNVACRNEWLDIVKWLVENVAHSMFDIDTSMNVLMLHSTEKNLAIFKLLLENISQTLFNIRSVIEQALRINHTEKVLLLLQTQNNTLFDLKYVMNEACRNSNLLVIKYVMENIDKKYFDVRSAMNKACRSAKPNSLEVVKLLLENIPHNMLNLESAMNNACRYDNVDVVRWFWDNLDRKLFNEKSSWNNAFYNCNEKMISYLLNNMDENMLDKSKALSKACQNIREGDKIMALLFKQPNMKTPENCKQVMTEACIHCNRNVVKWLMSHTDIQPLVYKTSLIDTIKATINMTNNRGKYDRISIVQFMLEHDSIKKLGQKDMSEVMEAVSSIGQLDMVQRLWHNTEQSMFNMRTIVNTACESGQFEIVDWFLRNNELKHIDVHTVMVESCGYGWLNIVKFLLSTFEMENFDMRTSVDEACSYGRYEIVKFLLENVDSTLLDTKLVLEKACGYGWKDITLWLFDNIDNIYIDIKQCMFEACAQGRLEIVELFLSKYGTQNFYVNKLIDVSCNSRNAGVVKFFIENFDLAQSHIDIIIKKACTYSWTEIVTLLIDVCKHNKNLMEEAMKTACINGETEIVEIFLDKIDISFLGVNTNMNISCQKGWDEIVSLLLERVDHSLFDFTAVMNEACRCGEADVVELLIQKVNRENFNFDTAIVEACKSHLNEKLVIILLKYINRSTIVIEAVSGKAYDNGWRRVSSRLKRMNYNDE